MKLFDFTKFCREYRIDIAQPGDKGFRQNWINVQCPFCRSVHHLLGYNVFDGYFVCWQCKWHPIGDVVRVLADVPEAEAWSIIHQYAGGAIRRQAFQRKLSDKCKLPKFTENLLSHHSQYLKKRGLDPDELVDLWKVRSCGPRGEYKHRVIIPIYLQKTLISYQGRDITGESSAKYKACASADEVIPHQESLYGVDLVPGDVVVVVEGVVDVWKLGPGAVATFGTAWLPEQAVMLRRFRKIIIVYDAEPDAQEQAKKLAYACLTSHNEVYTDSLKPGMDPGDLSYDESENLMKSYLGKEKCEERWS